MFQNLARRMEASWVISSSVRSLRSSSGKISSLDFFLYSNSSIYVKTRLYHQHAIDALSVERYRACIVCAQPYRRSRRCARNRSWHEARHADAPVSTSDITFKNALFTMISSEEKHSHAEPTVQHLGRPGWQGSKHWHCNVLQSLH